MKISLAYCLVLALIVTAFFLSGCVDSSACRKQLSYCQGDCDSKGYWLASDIESCKNRCSRDYSACMGS